MKWTYNKLKKNKTIDVYLVKGDYSIEKFKGTVEERMKEDVPELNIEKGDFWILCPSINQKIITKAKNITISNGKPCVFFLFKHPTGLKQSINRI